MNRGLRCAVRAALVTCVACLAACSGEDGSEGAATEGDTSGMGDAGVTSGGDAAPDTTQEAAEPIAWANGWEEGDALYPGLQMFLHDTWGLEANRRWPTAEFMVRIQQEQPETFGDQFARYGLIFDPADDLPVGLKRGTADPEWVDETCASCHTQVLPDGRHWLGAPNTAYRRAQLKLDLDAAWVAEGNPSLLGPGEREVLEAMGTARTTAGNRDYGIVPDDFPAIYDLASRTRLSTMGTTRDLKSEIYLSLFGFGAGKADDDGDIPIPFPDDAYLEPFVATFGAFSPPDNPSPPDAALVARGAEVYEEAGCGACHTDDEGDDVVPEYDRTEGAPEYAPGEQEAHPSGTIRTDGFQFGLVDGGGEGGDDPMFDESYEEFVLFIIEKGLSVGNSKGYVAPDLRGAWASAPYLHNGSVPTLADLLKPPAERPASFEVAPGDVRTTDAEGTTNVGHTFGAALSAEDKAALEAYLLTL